MITDRIRTLLKRCEAGDPSFPPSVLYNENWLLRLILDALAGAEGGLLPTAAGGRWFSEAWLPSAFLPRYRGDLLAESRTHADGVLGHFTIGDPGTAGLALAPDARQLVVIEAKLYNRLSTGVKNAPFYDQAARTVACIAEILRRADRDPASMDELAYVVVAPRARIDDGVFAWDLDPGAILEKVTRRAEQYDGERDAWLADRFEPALRRVAVRCLAWEDLLDEVALHRPETGQLLDAFYNECLRHNRRRARAAYPGRRSGSSRDWTPGPAPVGP